MNNLKQKFVFANDGDVFIGYNKNDIRKLNKNSYINYNLSVIKSNKNLKDYLNLLEDSSNMLEDYKDLLQTNSLDNDLNYVRNVYTIDFEGYLYGKDFETIKNISFVENDNYFEFCYNNKTNIVRDINSLEKVNNLEPIEATSFITRGVAFSNFLAFKEFEGVFDSNTRNLINIEVLKDNENMHYLKLDYEEGKSILVSEDNLVKVLKDFDLDLFLGLSNNEKPKDCPIEIYENIVKNNQDIYRFFSILKELEEMPRYYDNDKILELIEISSIALTSSDPVTFSLKMGGHILTNLIIDDLEGLGVPKPLSSCVLKFNGGLAENFINKGTKEIVLDEKTYEKIKELVDESIKEQSKEEALKRVPLKEEKKDKEIKDIEL